MIILTIRTDRPQAEVALFSGNEKLAEHIWEAHRTLADTIHKQIETLLHQHNCGWQNIEGIVCFKGPGSFTGLRIGLTVANAIAYGQGVPIVSAVSDEWQKDGISRLLDGQNETIALPHYGSEPNISQPKK